MSPSARPNRPFAGLLIALLVLACSGKAPATTAPSADSTPKPTGGSAARITDPMGSASDAWLVVGRAGDAGLRAILASTGERVLDFPTGVPDATWSRLVTASAHGSTTAVGDIAVQPGLGGASLAIEGAWRLPTLGADPMPVGVSDDGRTIVLVQDAGSDVSQRPVTTRFAILRRPFDAAPRIVELAGSFEFDTLSPDGSILYVVEHLAGPPDGHYQVRAIDTATGTLRDGVVVDKAEVDTAMAGWPIAQTRGPDGMVYTLYRGAEHPFIHALSSVDAWALCIDLPATGSADAAAALDWGLTVTADSRSLVAANATLGLVTRIPFSDLAAGRSVSFEPAASVGVTLAKFGHEAGGPVGRRLVASPIGSVLYAAGAGGIVRIGATDLGVTGRFLDGQAVDAMAITPDGATIYALLHAGGRIVKLDAASGAAVGEVPGAGVDRLVAVIPW
jgi:DNA-binding beta-propeller fold protein YncE